MLQRLAVFRDGFAVMSGYDLAARKGRIDIFNADGDYMAAAPFEGPFKYIHGTAEHLYTVGFDEDDTIVVHRYAVRGL